MSLSKGRAYYDVMLSVGSKTMGLYSIKFHRIIQSVRPVIVALGDEDGRVAGVRNREHVAFAVGNAPLVACLERIAGGGRGSN